MIYNKGDRVFDKLKNMYCTINYLRDDSYEKEMRHKNKICMENTLTCV